MGKMKSFKWAIPLIGLVVVLIGASIALYDECDQVGCMYRYDGTKLTVKDLGKLTQPQLEKLPRERIVGSRTGGQHLYTLLTLRYSDELTVGFIKKGVEEWVEYDITSLHKKVLAHYEQGENRTLETHDAMKVEINPEWSEIERL